MSSFKAIEKRDKTLLVEYKNKFKSNKFTDKRIGENDKSLSLEDKMFKRFVVQRQKPREKKSKKFNLNDDDDDEGFNGGFENGLTHLGQSIAEIENFESVQLSDDEEDDPNDVDKGKINAKIVSENFFGGFDKKENKEEDEESKKKNKKQWVEEMIMKSKQLKYERQKERDKTLDLTEKLDKEWRNIIPLIGGMIAKNKIEEEKANETSANIAKKANDYDILVRSLQFDSQKAKPTDKLKTAEELEAERINNLKKQEKELLERMTNEVVEIDENDKNKNKKNSKPSLKNIPANHYSVDDMDFNETEYLQERIREEIKNKNLNNLREEVENKEENNTDNDEEVSNEEDDEEEEVEDEDHNESDEDKISTKSNDKPTDEKWVAQFKSICTKLNKKLIDNKIFEKSMKALIEKLDPSKDESNKQRLCLLTEYLIEYYQNIFNIKSTTGTIDFSLVKILTSFVYNLTSKYGCKSTKKEPSPFIELFKKLIIKINNQFKNTKVTERKLPDLSVLFIFKLIAHIFPASDFRHQITTPCFLLMTRYLTQCPIQSIGDAFRGSFLCHLCYQFISLSKRYVPECIQYLNGILYLCIDWKNSNNEISLTQYELSTIYESFKRTKTQLLVKKKLKKLEELNIVNIGTSENLQGSDSINTSLIAYNLDLLKAFANIYEPISSFKEIFQLTLNLLRLLPMENYPEELQSRINNLKDFIATKGDKPREHLKCMSKKPVPSKMFEPKIQTKSKFDPKHHNSVISEKQLTARKYKKELKSAIKEIRQDNQYLARVQLQEQLEKDAKRAQKVKEIMGGLANQEGEYQKIKRQKI